MQLLKQSPGSATTVQFGPFLDETDGKTVETGLTIPSTSVFLSKNGGTFIAKNESTALTGTSDSLGYYDLLLDSGTDCAAVGRMRAHCHVAGALPVWEDFMIVSANEYDSMTGGDIRWADVLQVNSNSSSAVRLQLSLNTIEVATVDTTVASTTTTFECSVGDVTENTADHYKGRVVLFTSGTMFRQATLITAYSYTGALRGRFTVNALTEAPPNGVTFIIV